MGNQKGVIFLRSRFFHIILLSIVYAFSLYICDEQYIDTFKYSISYVTLTICSFVAVWYASKRQINLFLLYLLSFSLFIGGRFWIGIFDKEINIFESTYFFSYNVTSKNVSDLMTWVFSFIYFATIGFVLSRKSKIKLNRYVDKSMNSARCVTLAKVVFPIVLLCIMYQGVTEITYAFTYGYGVSLDDVTGREYNKSFITVINSFVGVMMLGFTYIYAKSEYPRYLKLYVVYGILILIGGSRFAFASILLIFIWLYSKEKSISLSRIAIYGAAGVVVLLVLFSLSSRGSGLEGFSLFDAFEIFLYSTGGSLMIFDASTLVNGYPWIAYLQTFLPGSTLVYSKLAGESLHMQDLTFQGHMCYNLNPGLYAQGAGLGWTTLSDLYLFSGANILFFSILAYCFGFYYAFLENKADFSPKYRFVLIAISQGVLMMPRGTSSPMFVGVIYALIFMFVVKQYMSRRVRKSVKTANSD